MDSGREFRIADNTETTLRGAANLSYTVLTWLCECLAWDGGIERIHELQPGYPLPQQTEPRSNAKSCRTSETPEAAVVAVCLTCEPLAQSPAANDLR